MSRFPTKLIFNYADGHNTVDHSIINALSYFLYSYNSICYVRRNTLAEAIEILYDREHRARARASYITRPITGASRRRVQAQNSISRIARDLSSSFLFICGPSGERRLANYDKQMRLGNAAVDDCSSQGLPDFYFSLSLFRSLSTSVLLSPRFFLSLTLSLSLLCPACPVRAFLFIASLPTREKEGERRRRCGVVWRRRRRRWKKKRLTQRLLFASFVIPLISLPAGRTENDGRRYLLSRARDLSFLLSPLYFPPPPSPLLYRAACIPSPGCNSGGLSAPRTAVYFYCDVLPPPILHSAPPRDANLSRRSGFFLSVLLLRVLSSFLSFFLSAPRSRCPWSVISRRGGDENARLGLRARGGVFFLAISLPPPHPPLLLLSAFFSLALLFFSLSFPPFLFLALHARRRRRGLSR